MAIKFTNLESIRSLTSPGPYEMYVDIPLDFKINPTTKDIAVSYDEVAVRNAVMNILNTRPGENFLFPDFGLDVSRELFTQVSNFNGQMLGESIQRSITKYEPRVSVQRVSVGVDEDRQQYDVTLVLAIPTIGQRVSFNPVFTSDGVYFNTQK